jgi:hypothetical protein
LFNTKDHIFIILWGVGVDTQLGCSIERLVGVRERREVLMWMGVWMRMRVDSREVDIFGEEDVLEFFDFELEVKVVFFEFQYFQGFNAALLAAFLVRWELELILNVLATLVGDDQVVAEIEFHFVIMIVFFVDDKFAIFFQ